MTFYIVSIDAPNLDKLKHEMLHQMSYPERKYLSHSHSFNSRTHRYEALITFTDCDKIKVLTGHSRQNKSV